MATMPWKREANITAEAERYRRVDSEEGFAEYAKAAIKTYLETGRWLLSRMPAVLSMR